MNKFAHLYDTVKHKTGNAARKVAAAGTLGLLSVPAFADTGADIQSQITSEISSNKAIAVAVVVAFIIARLSIKSLKLAKG